jgi:aspartate-semialdehyde dehydrogenase
MRIAVVGATGAVGATVLEILTQRDVLPSAEVVAFASERSVGTVVAFGDDQLICRALSDDAIDGFDVVFSAAGGTVSREWAPRFAAAGAIVVDKTSAWRRDPDVPLVVPEVNPHVVDDIAKGIVSSPNCSTMQLVVALNPIRQAAGLKEIVISTYQGVSGAGRGAVAELDRQTRAVLDGEASIVADAQSHQIAFNVVPQVEVFEAGSDPRRPGYTTEEIKVMWETRRIFGLDPEDDAALPISATCARVPVRTGHSQSVRVDTCDPLSAEQCRELLARAPGVAVVDDPATELYPTAIDGAGRDEVLVGRVRQAPGRDDVLSLWIVGDNLRKGAALNAVQVAELLFARGKLRARQQELAS